MWHIVSVPNEKKAEFKSRVQSLWQAVRWSLIAIAGISVYALGSKIHEMKTYEKQLDATEQIMSAEPDFEYLVADASSSLRPFDLQSADVTFAKYKGALTVGQGWSIQWKSPSSEGATPAQVLRALLTHIEYQQTTDVASNDLSKIHFRLIQVLEDLQGGPPSLGMAASN